MEKLRKTPSIILKNVLGQECNDYVRRAVHVAVDAMGIFRKREDDEINMHNPRTQRETLYGFNLEEYNNVIISLYHIIDETIKDGGKSFILYDHGRTAECDQFIELLSERTGIESGRFKTGIEQNLSTKGNTLFSWPEAYKDCKPKLSLMPDSIQYWLDYAEGKEPDEVEYPSKTLAPEKVLEESLKGTPKSAVFDASAIEEKAEEHLQNKEPEAKIKENQ